MALSERPDPTLSDMSLPVIEGRDEMRRIKAKVSTAKIPVIPLTACSKRWLPCRGPVSRPA